MFATQELSFEDQVETVNLHLSGIVDNFGNNKIAAQMNKKPIVYVLRIYQHLLQQPLNKIKLIT